LISDYFRYIQERDLISVSKKADLTADEVEKYLKALKNRCLGQDRDYSFKHIARYVCRDIYYSNEKFYRDFWNRMTERKGFSVGSLDNFKATIEKFIKEGYD
jgi:hypothetical protein